MPTKEWPKIPLFQKYTLEELAERTRYEKSYLFAIECGNKHPSRRFMDTVCLILNQSKETLFGENCE